MSLSGNLLNPLAFYFLMSPKFVLITFAVGCSVDVEVRGEHKKLMWALSPRLYTSPVSSSKEAVMGASPRTQCYKELQRGKVVPWKVLQSGWQDPKGGGNVGGPRVGLNRMQSKEVVGRQEALNLHLLLSL